MAKTIQIYVPAAGSAELSSLANGSGIVGITHHDGRIALYYEGNIYGANNMGTWQARVRQAAGRLIMAYPTSARTCCEQADVVLVGELTQYHDQDHYYGVGIINMPALVAHTKECDLDLLSAPQGQRQMLAMAELVEKLLKDEQLATIAERNALVEDNVLAIARALGITEGCLRQWFSPKDESTTWFSSDGKNQPGHYLLHACCNGTMNYKKWTD